MFILYAIPIGLLAGLLLRGRPAGLETLRIEGGIVILAALVIQALLFSTRLGTALGDEPATILYVGSTLAVLVVLLGNVRTPGVWFAVAGSALNLIAILANGGRMPASAEAYAVLGWTIPDTFANVAHPVEPALPWLTDVVPLPAWLPFTNVVSVGDLLIGAGIAVAIAAAMRGAGPSLHGSAAA